MAVPMSAFTGSSVLPRARVRAYLHTVGANRLSARAMQDGVRLALLHFL